MYLTLILQHLMDCPIGKTVPSGSNIHATKESLAPTNHLVLIPNN